MSSWKWMAAAIVGGWLGTGGLFGQDTGSSQASRQGATTVAPAASGDERTAGKAETAPAAEQGRGKVLFSRSDDEAAGESSAAGKSSPAREPAAAGEAEADQATAGERESLTFLAYDLDVHLSTKQGAIAVRARMTVRNDGERMLDRIGLQLSSTLKWERIRAGGAEARFAQYPLDSDADHTGSVNEAVIRLPRQLAPKEELKIEAFYSGSIPLSGERLQRIGAPATVAERSDWDRVSAEFNGLRGFGNVVWYPVSANPAMLGEEAKLFAEIGRQKRRQQQARVSITVSSEYTADAGPPKLAILDGQPVPVVQTAAPENSYPGVVTATLPENVLGFAAPSLFLLNRQKVEGSGVQVFTLPQDLPSAQSYLEAAAAVTPTVRQWLGATPKATLTLVGLPDSGDLEAEEGASFFSGFKASADPKDLQRAMVHSLAHAYFRSPRVWLSEGVPQFLGSLWVEQTDGRQAALETLGVGGGALALAEPASPGDLGGETLIDASNAVYYRTKAAYVLWMLRELAGDQHLAEALRSYVPDDDTTPVYFEELVERASGKDLKWFFEDWVYRDRGLPDFAIDGVFPTRSTTEGQWLVALDIANNGFATVEVPVTVRSKDATVTERLRIPAQGKVSRRVLIGGQPTEVQVNDGTVPEVQNSVHVRKLTAAAQ